TISGSRDSAQKKLYSTKGTKKKSSTHPRHMTADECLDALARCEWEMAMKNALKELALQLKPQRKQIDDHYKRLASEAQQEVRNQKEQERLDKQQQAAAEKQRKLEERKAKRKERELELELEKEQKKREAAERRELAAAKRAEEAARKKAATESRQAATIARKAAAAAVASSPRKCKQGKKAAVFPMSDHEIESDDETPIMPTLHPANMTPVRRNPARNARSRKCGC
ncbi:hypothetical protein BDQ17DRAFT_1358661, partial [Cyathus striatus]